MFSLSYTAAYDPYHAVFRMLVLLASTENGEIPSKTARAADFFYCFPWMLKDIRAPRSIEGFARMRNQIVRKYPKTSYDRFPSARVVYDRMELIQSTAVSALAGANMIEPVETSSKMLALKQESVPSGLFTAVEQAIEKTPDLLKFVAVILPQIEQLGSDGLFARTGLGEYSYDVV
ncbi:MULTISPECIES: ABC-three component system middle component 5 [unclassified Sulfitobacter]|uniref:ABC-three component system middle component 5 n=1 Tax=unclassified Sulfitobacter TaxID=196795 RepID=UPI0023E292DA|nr:MULTISPECIES: ABC-three component system middle component 5 [unclassified Sulfitobacter]MDF3460883.1 hypothetical protein [Sulfitobacter sp. S74]MDF3464793.1 hypothetical protein [Sulfitobacter sp. Ks18]MDF3480228.1 hypothetical protein [Sulfitobacter sp. M53]MDF3491926.1 hypothetical protein [Sulfitobacter sp. M60]MDF3495842.1 hypothetical protein [Sulfitobacter sp. M51]MDF3503641.1 hypothetical protein [Sulfitobacter sp. Ks17]MDF3534858.1 hypothetical protein [Sulfitobacter sp. S62]